MISIFLKDKFKLLLLDSQGQIQKNMATDCSSTHVWKSDLHIKWKPCLQPGSELCTNIATYCMWRHGFVIAALTNNSNLPRHYYFSRPPVSPADIK